MRVSYALASAAVLATCAACVALPTPPELIEVQFTVDQTPSSAALGGVPADLADRIRRSKDLFSKIDDSDARLALVQAEVYRFGLLRARQDADANVPLADLPLIGAAVAAATVVAFGKAPGQYSLLTGIGIGAGAYAAGRDYFNPANVALRAHAGAKAMSCVVNTGYRGSLLLNATRCRPATDPSSGAAICLPVSAIDDLRVRLADLTNAAAGATEVLNNPPTTTTILTRFSVNSARLSLEQAITGASKLMESGANELDALRAIPRHIVAMTSNVDDDIYRTTRSKRPEFGALQASLTKAIVTAKTADTGASQGVKDTTEGAAKIRQLKADTQMIRDQRLLRLRGRAALVQTKEEEEAAKVEAYVADAEAAVSAVKSTSALVRSVIRGAPDHVVAILQCGLISD